MLLEKSRSASPPSALRHRIVPGTPFPDDVPAEIRALVERCLSKEPSQRPTAPELLAELADTDVSAAWRRATLRALIALVNDSTKHLPEIADAYRRAAGTPSAPTAECNRAELVDLSD